MSTVKSPRATATPAAEPANPAFGEALSQLEALVGQLEGDPDLDLDAALELYERGAALAALCRERMRGAELRLTEISTAALAEPAGA